MANRRVHFRRLREGRGEGGHWIRPSDESYHRHLYGGLGTSQSPGVQFFSPCIIHQTRLAFINSSVIMQGNILLLGKTCSYRGETEFGKQTRMKQYVLWTDKLVIFLRWIHPSLFAHARWTPVWLYTEDQKGRDGWRYEARPWPWPYQFPPRSGYCEYNACVKVARFGLVEFFGTGNLHPDGTSI
jgi:hypothetical protein